MSEDFKKEFSLNDYEYNLINSNKDVLLFFLDTITLEVHPKTAVFWLDKILSLNSIQLNIIKPEHIAELDELILDGTISGFAAIQVFEQCYLTGINPKKIITQQQI